jgi:hypothetical protein
MGKFREPDRRLCPGSPNVSGGPDVHRYQCIYMNYDCIDCITHPILPYNTREFFLTHFMITFSMLKTNFISNVERWIFQLVIQTA